MSWSGIELGNWPSTSTKATGWCSDPRTTRRQPSRTAVSTGLESRASLSPRSRTTTDQRRMQMTTSPTSHQRYEPDLVLPPGDTLLEVLEDRGMTQAELAARTGLSAKHINQIAKGVAPVTPDTALLLES